jgi:sugar lactone lactonase YvrE
VGASATWIEHTGNIDRVLRGAILVSGLAAASCGRIGFQLTGDGTGSSSGDAGGSGDAPGPKGTLDLVVGRPGGFGLVDGAAGSARFDCPSAVAVDAAGTIYVSDTRNHLIRAIDASGVRTLAGGPAITGFVDGTGAAARFQAPHGIVLDPAGNLYVTDRGNNAIRKVTPAGVVTTVAGNGTSGSTDGASTVARFSHPTDITIDPSGNLYVADTWNCTIREITPAGVVSTIGGLAGQCVAAVNGTAAASRFNFPRAVTYANGFLYVADRSNGAIRRWDGTMWSTAAGGLAYPRAVAVDGAGVIYTTDGGQVRKYATGGWTTIAGTGSCGYADGTGASAAFCDARGATLDASGNVVVADSRNGMIRRVSPTGVVTTIAGGSAPNAGDVGGSASNARFFHPFGIAVHANLALVTEGDFYGTVGDTIRSIALPVPNVTTLAGTFNSSGATDATGTAALFYLPHGVAIDSQGNAFVADTQNCTLREITPGGVVTTIAGAVGACAHVDGAMASSRFSYPTGVAIDASDALYITDDPNGGVIRKLAAGTVTTVAGSSGNPGNIDGPVASARFRSPGGIAVDAGGTLYVADTHNHSIRVISPQGNVTTLAGAPAGTPAPNAVVDGIGSAARFNNPQAVAVDPAGTVFVCDESGTLRRVSPSGVVDTVAGVAGTRNVVTGALPGGLSGCTGLYAIGVGELYVIDSVENVVLHLLVTN